jgi:hypothetical protein
MNLPEIDKQHNSRIYSQILSILEEKCPGLGFEKHLLLPDSDTTIHGVTLSSIVECSNFVTAYGKLIGFYIFRYTVNIDFLYNGARTCMVIDYRYPERYFTKEFLSRFSVGCKHQYTSLYCETGGYFDAEGHNYLCKQCLKTKSLQNRLLNSLNIVKRFFRGIE